jgi:hypothetical protein
MTVAIRDAVVSVALATFVLLAAMCALRLVRYVRLRHPLANRRFLRRYRAAHSLHRGITGEAKKVCPAVSANPVHVRGARVPAGKTAGLNSVAWSMTFARSVTSGSGIPVGGGDALPPSTPPPTPWPNGLERDRTYALCTSKHRPQTGPSQTRVPPPSLSRRMR